jgi:hypothetical protein
MPTFCVTREAVVVVVVHAAADTVAIRMGEETLRARVDDAALSTGTTVLLHDGEVEAHPVAPFDPYEIAVPVEVTVTVEGRDEATARERGVRAVADVLAALHVRWDAAGEAVVVPA